MKLLGAEVIQTNKSAIAIARQIKDSNPDNVVMLDQVRKMCKKICLCTTTKI